MAVSAVIQAGGEPRSSLGPRTKLPPLHRGPESAVGIPGLPRPLRPHGPGHWAWGLGRSESPRREAGGRISRRTRQADSAACPAALHAQSADISKPPRGTEVQSDRPVRPPGLVGPCWLWPLSAVSELEEGKNRRLAGWLWVWGVSAFNFFWRPTRRWGITVKRAENIQCPPAPRPEARPAWRQEG